MRPVGKLKEQNGTCRLLLGRLGADDAEVFWEGNARIGIRFGDELATVARCYSDLVPADFLAVA